LYYHTNPIRAILVFYSEDDDSLNILKELWKIFFHFALNILKGTCSSNLRFDPFKAKIMQEPIDAQNKNKGGCPLKLPDDNRSQLTNEFLKKLVESVLYSQAKVPGVSKPSYLNVEMCPPSVEIDFNMLHNHIQYYHPSIRCPKNVDSVRQHFRKPPTNGWRKLRRGVYTHMDWNHIVNNVDYVNDNVNYYDVNNYNDDDLDFVNDMNYECDDTWEHYFSMSEIGKYF